MKIKNRGEVKKLKIKGIKTNKLLLIIAGLIFGFGIVLVSALRVSQAQVRAQATVDESQAEPVSIKAVDGQPKAEEEPTDYYLPYPGILPDHPLYWLKMVRDRIMLKLTKDPAQRLGRLLLYADKRIGAAKALVEGGKTQLGITTATKAEKYFGQVVDQYKELKEANKDTPEMATRLTKAAAKHQEVLTDILDQVPDQGRATIEQYIEGTNKHFQWLNQVRLGK